MRNERDSATDVASLTGFPDLIVPAGFTGDRVPAGIFSKPHSGNRSCCRCVVASKAPGLKGETITLQ